MGIGSFGIGEMLVIGIFVLIFFGPRRMPEIARSLGKAMREFKKGVNEIQRELDIADRETRQATRTTWQPPSGPAAKTPEAGEPTTEPQDLTIQPPPSPDYPTTPDVLAEGADAQGVPAGDPTEPIPVKRPPVTDVESESAIEGLYMGGPPGSEPVPGPDAMPESEAMPGSEPLPDAETGSPEVKGDGDDSQSDLFRGDEKD